MVRLSLELGCFLAATAAMTEARSEPSMLDCVNSFGSLRFEIFDYGKYDTNFRNNSKMVNPEAGTYLGPEDIEEYVRVADEKSPFIEKSDTVVNVPFFKSVNQTSGTCKFLTYQVRRQEMNPELAQEATVLRGVFIQIEYDYHENYISEIDLYYRTEYAELFFGTVLNNDKIRNFICEVAETNCPDTNVGISREQCVSKLKELPVLTNGLIDGKDYGCRVLHSVFAQINEKHCPHISFEPQEDINGKTKCQVSEEVNPYDIFDEEDIEDFHEFLESPLSMIESLSGYKILNMPKKLNKAAQYWINLCVPTGIVVLVFLLVKNNSPKAKASECKTSNTILINKLWIIGGTIAAAISLAYGLSGLSVWVATRSHPEWQEEEDASVDLRDMYLGHPPRISSTVPLQALSDDQFLIYSGMFIWVTCMLCGLGLELFFWYYFLKVWTEAKEGLWRFAQFVFPFATVSAIGFAVHLNFLAIPFLLVGLFKFGFPEIFMYTFLGLFSTTNLSFRKAADLLNGIGTAIHHSAVVMIASMCLVGVLSGTRYSWNCVMVALMQHWVVLLAYTNKRLYAAIVLILEFYFEWCIISDFPQMYKLHWIGAVSAGVVLLAHWLYLVAAVLNVFTDGALGHEGSDNIHIRGAREIEKVCTYCHPICPESSGEFLFQLEESTHLAS